MCSPAGQRPPPLRGPALRRSSAAQSFSSRVGWSDVPCDRPLPALAGRIEPLQTKPAGDLDDENDGTEMIELEGVGVRLAVDIAGDRSAPPVLFFHGGVQIRHSWRFTLDSLAASGWCAVSVGLRRRGDSGRDADGDYSLEALAADVFAVAGPSTGRPRSGHHPAARRASPRSVVILMSRGRWCWWTSRRLSIRRARPASATSCAHAESGFASLDEVADAVQAYNPRRSRPSDLSSGSRNGSRNGVCTAMTTWTGSLGDFPAGWTSGGPGPS